MADLFLAHLLGRLSAGVIALEGPELRYRFVNARMRRLVGADSDGQPVRDYPGQLPAALVAILPQVYASGEPYVAQERLAPEPGADTGQPAPTYDFFLDPYHDAQGRVAGLVVLAVDVSAQVQTHARAQALAQQTRQLDARLRVLSETAPLTSYSLDATGACTYMSPQWYRFTGQPLTTDVTAVWPLLIHPDDRLRVLFDMDRARQQGVGWNHEYRLRRYDGAFRWVLSRALPEVHLPEAPVAWHGVVLEVHHAHELSEARRQGEAALRFLADSIPELIFTASAEGLSDYYNQYATDYSGLSPQALGPTGWVGLLYPEEQAAAARRWVQSVATGVDFEGEHRLRRHDGTYRWHLIRARRLWDGEHLRWFGTCADVDTQYRLREALQTQYDELARTHHDLDTFVYAASHDLRQPALNLRGLFDELRRTASFADAEEALLLGMVDASLQQLDTTLTDLAATVRTQRPQPEPAELLDVELLVQELLLGLHAQVLERQARVEVDLHAAPGLRYSRAKLRSVLHNLLSNALKFAHPNRPPHVVVRSYLTPDGQPVLQVQDNGLGMRVDDPQQPTFALFTRQHAQVAGTGVGLYLVQRIVDSQGGRLEVTSTLGEGTTFTIYWTAPAHATSTAGRLAHPAASPVSSTT